MAVGMPSRLYRSRSDKMIAGVSGGLGEYFDVDPVLIRMLFVVTTLLSGVGLLAYVVLWILVPRQGDDTTPREQVLRGEVADLYREARERIDPDRAGGPAPGAGAETVAGATTAGRTSIEDDVGVGSPTGESVVGGEAAGTSVPPPPPRPATVPVGPDLAERRRRRQHWAGAILIVIGALFLAQNLGLLWWIRAQYFLPLLLVGAGAWLLFGRSRSARF